MTATNDAVQEPNSAMWLNVSRRFAVVLQDIEGFIPPVTVLLVNVAYIWVAIKK